MMMMMMLFAMTDEFSGMGNEKFDDFVDIHLVTSGVNMAEEELCKSHVGA
jgi:hypothetical protein